MRPALDRCPCGRAKFWGLRCQNVEILEKIARCARQKRPPDSENHDLGCRTAKSEDPSKMAYSISDFVSRDWTKTQEFFQDLESTSPRTKIKT